MNCGMASMGSILLLCALACSHPHQHACIAHLPAACIAHLPCAGGERCCVCMYTYESFALGTSDTAPSSSVGISQLSQVLQGLALDVTNAHVFAWWLCLGHCAPGRWSKAATSSAIVAHYCFQGRACTFCQVASRMPHSSLSL